MNFHIDRLSFLLGFLLASLGWFLLSKLRTSWPGLRKQIERKTREIRERNLSGLENVLRQATIERAQSQHFAARMFALEDLLVEPCLLAAPSAGDPAQQAGQEPVIPQIVPYLPDQPQLPSQLHYPSFTIDEALQSGRVIAVIARPGAGKTVALADFAIRSARRQCSPEIANLVPLYCHVQDLDILPNLPDDPAIPLQKVITRQVLVIYHRQVPAFLRTALTGGRALLILDGVDELPPHQLAGAAAWLKSLRAQYPSVRVVTTGDPAYLDGLLSAGLIPLALARWRPDDARRFVRRWKKAWDRDITPQIAASNERQPIDTRLFEQWLSNPSPQRSPLEWTALIWALFAGDVTGPQPSQAIEAYIRRVLSDQGHFEPLTHLAAHLIQSGQAAVPIREIAALVGEWVAQQAIRPGAVEVNQLPNQSAKKDVEKTRPLSAGMKVVDALVGSGLLVEYPNEMIAFSHPTVCGFLASRSPNLENLQETPSVGVLCWSIQTTCLRYLFTQAQATELVSQLLTEDTAPLHANLAWLCSFLNDCAAPAAWRNRVMRSAIQRLQDERLPVTSRARLVSALCESNDPSIAVLFRQLTAAPAPTVRRLAALGSGALQDTKAINELTALLNDSDPGVRYAACLSLASLPSEASREAVTAALAGDDDLRQVSAEALSSIGLAGHEILLAAVESPDLLVRRAAVLGLALIDEPWVHEVLEKRAIEDGQWIVRNSAAQALEMRGQPRTFVPHPLPPPSESGWLIQFASRCGESVPRGQSPLPILLKALSEGSPAEQRAAIDYLRRSSDPEVIERLFELTGQSSPVSEAATYALWWLTASGVQLPTVLKQA